jgi:hypothetical protein
MRAALLFVVVVAMVGVATLAGALFVAFLIAELCFASLEGRACTMTLISRTSVPLKVKKKWRKRRDEDHVGKRSRLMMQNAYLKTPPLDNATRTRSLTSGKAGRVKEALKSVAPVFECLRVRVR